MGPLLMSCFEHLWAGLSTVQVFDLEAYEHRGKIERRQTLWWSGESPLPKSVMLLESVQESSKCSESQDCNPFWISRVSLSYLVVRIWQPCPRVGEGMFSRNPFHHVHLMRRGPLDDIFNVV